MNCSSVKKVLFYKLLKQKKAKEMVAKMDNYKFSEFIQIAKKLNEVDIFPLLMGSVGLEVVTRESWEPQDLDIHVPGDKRGWEIPPELCIYNWQRIVSIMNSLGYRLIDLHEHEFLKEGQSVGFAIINTLPDFAGIQLKDLKMHETNGAKYYLLSPAQYLKVYESSSKDSYRADKNNRKDFRKIDYLKRMIYGNGK